MLRSFTASLKESKAKKEGRKMKKAVESVNLVEYPDIKRTRRRIEDFLRKNATEGQIRGIAELLGVEEAKIYLPMVEEEEIRFAELWEAQIEGIRGGSFLRGEAQMEARKNLPKKFTLYYVSRPHYPGDENPARYSPNLFTREAAENLLYSNEGYNITELDEDIISMREKIRGTNPKELLVEDRETFRLLKQLLFPAK